MNQGKVKLVCVAPDKDGLLSVNQQYTIDDYYYSGNEVLCECDHRYIKWFPSTCFGYSNIDELLKDVNN